MKTGALLGLMIGLMLSFGRSVSAQGAAGERLFLKGLLKVQEAAPAPAPAPAPTLTPLEQSQETARAAEEIFVAAVMAQRYTEVLYAGAFSKAVEAKWPFLAGLNLDENETKAFQEKVKAAAADEAELIAAGALRKGIMALFTPEGMLPLPVLRFAYQKREPNADLIGSWLRYQKDAGALADDPVYQKLKKTIDDLDEAGIKKADPPADLVVAYVVYTFFNTTDSSGPALNESITKLHHEFLGSAAEVKKNGGAFQSRWGLQSLVPQD